MVLPTPLPALYGPPTLILAPLLFWGTDRSSWGAAEEARMVDRETQD